MGLIKYHSLEWATDHVPEFRGESSHRPSRGSTPIPVSELTEFLLILLDEVKVLVDEIVRHNHDVVVLILPQKF